MFGLGGVFGTINQMEHSPLNFSENRIGEKIALIKEFMCDNVQLQILNKITLYIFLPSNSKYLCC